MSEKADVPRKGDVMEIKIRCEPIFDGVPGYTVDVVMADGEGGEHPAIRAQYRDEDPQDLDGLYTFIRGELNVMGIES